jgi:oligopeptide transport system substrate-binding protein
MISQHARGFFLCACFVFLAGCFGGGENADLIIINGREPDSIDPALILGQADGRVAQTLFEGLTRYNPKDASAEPGLSDRWTISNDKKTYTFHIRENAKWSNGDPITAHDFVYSWMRVLDPSTGSDYSGNLYYIRGAEAFNSGASTNPASVGIVALDDRTLRVELVNPTPFFLELCAYATQTIVHRATVEKYGDRWLNSKNVPCSGAFQLDYWRLHDRIRVRKNPNYWDAANTQLQVVDLLPVSLASTALNLYETKEADIIWDKDLVPSEILDALKGRPDFHSSPLFASYFYRCNTTRKPFTDARVRKAFAMVIDRKRIVEKITRGGEIPANFIVPPELPDYTSPDGLPYDPEAARRLLAEAGFPNGDGLPRIEYTFRSSRDDEKVAVELKDMWKRELNVDVGLRGVEHSVWLQLQGKLQYDLIRSSWVGDYSDPNTFLGDLFMSNSPNNRTGWKNPTYDALIRKANSLPDPKQRAGLLRQAEKILIYDDAPIVPLYIYNGFSFWDPQKITGIYGNIRDEHPVRSIRRLAPRK